MPITKKQAIRVLKNNQNLGQNLESFFNAIIYAKLPQHYLERFRHYKGHSDVLISDYDSYVKQIYSGKENFKGRVNVIIGISLELDSIVDQGIVKDERLLAHIKYFRGRDWNAERGKKGEYFTTPTELRLINTMLDTVIEYLKATYSFQTTKKEAIRVLKNNKNMIPVEKSFFQAIIDGKLPQHYLERLKHFQGTITNEELPRSRLQDLIRIKGYSDDLVSDEASLQKQRAERRSGRTYKACSAVILDLKNGLELLVRQGIIKDQNLIVQIGAFITRKWNWTNGKGHYTTPEEIKLINTMLDTTIECLRITYAHLELGRGVKDQATVLVGVSIDLQSIVGQA